MLGAMSTDTGRERNGHRRGASVELGSPIRQGPVTVGVHVRPDDRPPIYRLKGETLTARTNYDLPPGFGVAVALKKDGSVYDYIGTWEPRRPSPMRAIASTSSPATATSLYVKYGHRH